MGLMENIKLCQECLDLVRDDLLNYIKDNGLSKYSLEELERLYESFEVTQTDIIVVFAPESRYEHPNEIVIPIRDVKNK
jgi:hypothetical protein